MHTCNKSNTARLAGIILLAAVMMVAGGCAHQSSLKEARAGFTTNLLEHWTNGTPAPQPTDDRLTLVKYPSNVGELSAYLTRDPGDGKKHQAIVWICGGYDNSIGSFAWDPAPEEDDRSARVFRENGVVTMYASLRGCNDNPGDYECFYGEADDVLSAVDYVSKLPYVDPDKVYLGGHSTGGTMVLLAAELSDGENIRAVFSIGPVSDILSYGLEYPFSTSDKNETRLRSPGYWVPSIKTRTYIMEGADSANAADLPKFANRNDLVTTHRIPGYDHFTEVKPLTESIAKQILADNGGLPNFVFQ
jgi:alpha/beta superfamily hydrolase